MTYSKALLLSEAANADFDLTLADGNTVRLDYGYPEAQLADLTNVVDDLESFQNTAGGAGAGSTIVFYPAGYNADGADGNDNCFVTYTSAASSGSEASVVADITEC